MNIRQQMKAAGPALRTQRAFTLMELLVVMAVIAILLGMILPSYNSVRDKAKYTKAKVTVKNLETAFNAYLDRYRVWDATFGSGANPIDATIVSMLKGQKIAGNSDGVVFYEFEMTNAVSGALDPWSNPSDPTAVKTYYYFQVDHDYDNRITRDGQQISRTVIVWSPGADRTNYTSDDVKSWD